MQFVNRRQYGWSRNDSGLTIFFDVQGVGQKAAEGQGPIWAIEGHQWMLRLLECGDAEVAPAKAGISIATEDAVRLDLDYRERFDLPPSWPGILRLETKGVPNLRDFDAVVRLIDSRGQIVSGWRLEGPILTVSGTDFYLPTASQYACLIAFEQWSGRSDRSEVDHLRLLHCLSEAEENGCRIDLRRAPDVDIQDADECVIEVVEKSDGSLELTPLISSLLSASGVTPQELRDQISERLHHLEGENAEAIIRVGKKIVILNPVQTQQARTVARRRVVPKDQKESFRADPQRWLADHVFVHGAVEFLPRVLGIGEWTGGYLGAGGELGEPVDWFDKQPEAEKPEAAKKESKDEETSEGDGVDSSPDDKEQDEDDGGPLVTLIEKNDDELRWGLPHGSYKGNEDPGLDLQFEGFPRTPFPHQVDAIKWLAGHTERAGKATKWKPEDKAWGAGALLADDMGLGKTYTTILFLGLWYETWRRTSGEEPPACLVVAPLSLVENWKEEIEKSFPPGQSPFRRIVEAIPAVELKRFYATSNGRDRVSTQEIAPEVEEYGLKFGSGTEECLDFPGSIVITTYQTLREFRFSFAGCEWGAAVFDEAQNIKNPNALQTIASKSLKAFFRLALTGTPVENHLGDLWSLMDAIEPGALGSFAQFRNQWIRPLRDDKTQMEEIGLRLRAYLNDLILRRTKEESLEGLPKKTIEPVEIPMSDQQIELYEEILNLAKQPVDTEAEQGRTNRHLACMWELRRITLHPDLIGGATPESATDASSSRQYFYRSGKLRWLLEILDDVRENGEKVLIFAVQKRLQDMLVSHLGRIYDLKIPLINGDTKAASKTAPNETRLGLIKQFCADPGFGICVLSPIAAGAGLNIVAANHVIHLERHWNPAKEDQATDRAYRIGQKKDVHVHLPILVHPGREVTTFDMGLDKLISQKRNLAGSLGLMPVASVSANDLFSQVFGSGPSCSAKSKKLTLAEALKLSWEFFEALIAVLYEREAQSVILSPRGRDSGADVVVIGHEPTGTNLLIQCKSSGKDTLDSEKAVREVIGSRPIYEAKLGLSLPNGIVHTTAIRFSKRTKRAARDCSVELLGRQWLSAALKRHQVTFAQVTDRNGRRKRL